MLVHGPGPKYGQPYRLEPFARRFLYRLYEYDPLTGRRIARRALLGLPKGNAKTELMAAVGLLELAGPVAPLVPNIPVGAASYAQAGILFETARVMVTEGPLNDWLECYEDRIQVRDGPGRLFKVAAEAGTNDGGRPTCFIADELHEWLLRKARVHLVIENSTMKSAESLTLNISTAGADRDTLLGDLYDYGLQVAAGEIVDPSFLFEWWEGPEDVDFGDGDSVRAAVLACNPGADVFWPAENLVRRARQIPENEYRRYHLNQWTSGATAYLPSGVWEGRLHPTRRRARASDPCTIPDGTEVVITLDGSYSNDSTGITVHELASRHMDVWAAWERPVDARHDWRVPLDEVEAALRDAFRRLTVRELAADGFLYRQILERLADDGFPVVEIPQGKQMSTAAQGFYESATSGLFTHSGDPRLTRHIGNAVVKDTPAGPKVMKETRTSRRKIDLGVCAIMGDHRAAAIVEQEPELQIW